MMAENNLNHTHSGAGTSCERTKSGREKSEASQVVIMQNLRRAERQRTTWTKKMNKIVMKCYYKSNPNVRGYRKRMHKIWKEEGLSESSEQNLSGQARAIKTHGWLSEIELEESRRDTKRESELLENEEIIVETTNAESNEVELSEGMKNTDNNVIENGTPTESIEDKMRSDGLGDDDIRVLGMLQEELQKELIN